jgi:hypothetical protein
VALLAELVGFQTMTRGPSSSPGVSAGAGAGYSGLAARIDDLRGRGDNAGLQPPFESSRWLDDGDGLPAEPPAQAIVVRDPRSRV